MTSTDPQLQRRVLVTGGAGFIGSELVRQLVEGGSRVTAVDNLVNGSAENLKGLPSGQVQLVVADIREGERMKELLGGIDTVFHLAALGVRHSIHSPRENHEVNATASLKLLTAAREKGVKRFVYVSSSEVYGTALRTPMDESHPTFPMTVYGASKLAGEGYARAFYRTYKFPTVVIRPFNTYGPRCHHEGDSGEVIPKFLLRSLAGRPLVILGDGTQTRDFTYVSDIARGISTIGFSEKTVGETVNLGSGQEIEINQLAAEVASILGRPRAEIVHQAPRPGDTLRLCADITRARRLVGFQPEVSLRQGLEKLRDWYRGRPQAPETLLEEEVTVNWEAEGGKSHV